LVEERVSHPAAADVLSFLHRLQPVPQPFYRLGGVAAERQLELGKHIVAVAAHAAEGKVLLEPTEHFWHDMLGRERLVTVPPAVDTSHAAIEERRPTRRWSGLRPGKC
jgi:hypothetical protein